MKNFKTTAAVAAALALSASPAFAVERSGPPTTGGSYAGTVEPTAPTAPTAGSDAGSTVQPTAPTAPTVGSDTGSDQQIGTTQSRPAETPTAESNPGTERKLAAAGRYCKDASKKPVKGEKGSAFSACVKAQARLRGGKADSPREACKGASKKRVKGEKGTAFSICVKAATKFLKDQDAQQEEQEIEQEQTQDATATE